MQISCVVNGIRFFYISDHFLNAFSQFRRLTGQCGWHPQKDQDGQIPRPAAQHYGLRPAQRDVCQR